MAPVAILGQLVQPVVHVRENGKCVVICVDTVNWLPLHPAWQSQRPGRSSRLVPGSTPPVPLADRAP